MFCHKLYPDLVYDVVQVPYLKAKVIRRKKIKGKGKANEHAPKFILRSYEVKKTQFFKADAKEQGLGSPPLQGGLWPSASFPLWSRSLSLFTTVCLETFTQQTGHMDINDNYLMIIISAW